MAFQPKGYHYVLGTGVGLVGSFLIFKAVQKYLARKKFEELKRQAVTGEISTTTFLKKVLVGGQPDPTGRKIIPVPDPKRMLCTDVFPASFFQLPDFALALDSLRRDGTCL